MREEPLIDRLKFAVRLSAGKRVLDIGGQKAYNCPTGDPYAAAYRKISGAAGQYAVLDRDPQDGVDYAADLNTADGREKLTRILDEYRPDVVICMEILEHLNYPCEIMARSPTG